jgi:hypothetical protein
MHLHHGDREPLRVEKDGQVLWGPEWLRRLDAACRADLEAHPTMIPSALGRLAEREAQQ